MPHRKLMLLLLLFSLLLPIAPVAAAQGGPHTVYLPQLAAPADALDEDAFGFEPQPEVSAANAGTIYFTCAAGQTAAAAWWAHAAGTMTILVDLLNVNTGATVTLVRYVSAYKAGTIGGSVNPEASYKVLRFRWSFSSSASTLSQSCGAF